MFSVSKSTLDPSKDINIEFGVVGKQHNSIDKKLMMKLDTGADVNAINRKTFKKLFPDVQLRPSSTIPENFDKTLVRPMGTFKCFLRWKSNVYRVDMNQDDSPNVLSRATTFIMGILKLCFMATKKEGVGEKKFSDAKNSSSL